MREGRLAYIEPGTVNPCSNSEVPVGMALICCYYCCYCLVSCLTENNGLYILSELRFIGIFNQRQIVWIWWMIWGVNVTQGLNRSNRYWCMTYTTTHWFISFSLINLVSAVNDDLIIAPMDEWSLLWNARHCSSIQGQNLAPMTENICRRKVPPAGQKRHNIQKHDWRLLINLMAARCKLCFQRLHLIIFIHLLLKKKT